MKEGTKSTLEKIALQVFQAKSCEAAKAIMYEYLKESTINPKDRNKMLADINKIGNLIRLQNYLTNSLLKFEGMSLTNKK